MSKQLIIFPFGGNGREAAANIVGSNALTEEWELLGFADDDSSLLGREVCGVRVLGGRDILKKFPDARILAVPGKPENYLERKNIINGLEISKDKFANIISPGVNILPDVKIGKNILLMSNVVISCGVSIGNHCVILPNTTILHDSKVGEYCCIGSNVVVAGNVTIDSNCYIGAGVSIRESITIGKQSLVGMGANVIADVDPKTMVVGNPAKIIKKRTV